MCNNNIKRNSNKATWNLSKIKVQISSLYVLRGTRENIFAATTEQKNWILWKFCSKSDSDTNIKNICDSDHIWSNMFFVHYVQFWINKLSRMRWNHKQCLISQCRQTHPIYHGLSAHSEHLNSLSGISTCSTQKVVSLLQYIFPTRWQSNYHCPIWNGGFASLKQTT